MKYIDEKYKDEHPEKTVDRIIKKLNSIEIYLDEKYNDSGIENCHSLRVSVKGGVPGTNGKGVSKEFARASGYGEFMERLESGLFFYKYQSFENDEKVCLQSYAYDKKYVTVSELEENGDWMDPIVKKYGVTRKQIAQQCAIYAGSDNILVVPYYSIFEDKYVYLPTAFVEHIYSANGCCVGNTREEAWVHALSEILERNANIEILKSGKPAPIISREKLKRFEVVNNILDKIEKTNKFDVEIFDYSCGRDFPIIATRIINRETKGYLVNVGADPIFEIAVQRTLTEIFQGRNIENFSGDKTGVILKEITDMNISDNILNQLETGNGIYTVDFFAGDLKSDSEFTDNTGKTNKQLIEYVLKIYKDIGLPVYVRNYSFLDFPCYKFVVPGFSESRGERLKEVISSYYFGDKCAKTLRNIKCADKAALTELLMYKNMVANIRSKKFNYNFLAGLPFNENPPHRLLMHYVYAAYKLNNKKIYDECLITAISCITDEKDRDYLLAIRQWQKFMSDGVKEEVAFKVLERFYFTETISRLKRNIATDALFDEFVVECIDCKNCRHSNICQYKNIKKMMTNVGGIYNKFTNGQDKENFMI